VVIAMKNNNKISLEISLIPIHAEIQNPILPFQKKAQKAKDYIISQGIDAKRVSAKGFGESLLLNQCKDDVLVLKKSTQRTEGWSLK